MSGLFNWLLFAVTFLLAGLLLGTVLHKRRKGGEGAGPSTSGSISGSVEIEDALKAAYTLQVSRGAWNIEELAEFMNLPVDLIRDMTAALAAAGWSEKSGQGGMQLT